MSLLFAICLILLVLVLIYDVRNLLHLGQLHQQHCQQTVTTDNIPLISVARSVDIIVPIYNMGDSFPRTLVSIESSRYPNKRLIVVNDGSDDGETTHILNELKDRIDILVHLPHAGKASAANHGASLGKADILMFLDADSFVTADFIEIALAELDETTDAVDFVPQVANPNASIWTQIAAFERAMLALTPDNFGALFVIKRAIFEKLLFRPGSAPQFELNQRLLKNGQLKTATQKTVFSDEPVAFRALYRRKRRWLYGMLETLRLHQQATGWQIYLPFIDLLLLSSVLLSIIDLKFLLIPLSLILAWLLKAYVLTKLFKFEKKFLAPWYVIYMVTLMVAVVEAMLRFKWGNKVPWS